MDLDRDRIVRRDFPLSEDGYERGAVDAHLEAIAAALAAAGAPGPAGAAADAERALLTAGRRVLGQLSSARVELKNLSAALRDQGAAISDALEVLLDPEAGADADASPAPPDQTGAGSVPPPASRPAVPPAASRASPAPSLPAASPAPSLPAASPAPPPSTLDPVVADARLVALDMALSGSSREEIAGALAARFELADPAALVDEVLAAIG